MPRISVAAPCAAGSGGVYKVSDFYSFILGVFLRFR